MASLRTSGAAAASLVVKASEGVLKEIRVYNANAAAQFIQIHNTLLLPADANAPVDVFKIPAESSASYTPPEGLYLDTGIILCNSSTYATKTIGAADCWFAADYE